jgi:hypothetical protein
MSSDFALYRARPVRTIMAVALLPLLWACGDQGPSAPQPASIEIISGPEQGQPGQTLTTPLVIRVLDAAGGNVPNAAVTFSASGGGSFSPVTATTGTDGRAQSVWTLGSTPGQQTATVSVGTVTATSTAMAADPCDQFVQYTIGTEVDATFTTASCSIGGYRTGRFRFTLSQQTSLSIQQFSQVFDTYLELYDANDVFVAFGFPQADNSPDTEIRAILPAGTYEIWPSTYDQGVTGAYSLNSAVVAAPYGDCAVVWMRRGVQTTQTFSAQCEVNVSGVNHAGYITYFWLPAGVGRTITQSAAEGETIMRVYQYNFQTGQFSQLHDGRSTPGAPTTFGLPSGAGLFAVVSAEGAPGQGGTYTLGIQ